MAKACAAASLHLGWKLENMADSTCPVATDRISGRAIVLNPVRYRPGALCKFEKDANPGSRNRLGFAQTKILIRSPQSESAVEGLLCSPNHESDRPKTVDLRFLTDSRQWSRWA